MKKGYVLFVLVGVVIGWWILKVSDSKNKKLVLLSEQKTDETEIKTTNNLVGESIETVESVGIVESWDSKNGELVLIQNGKSILVKIDPSKMVLFVNSLKVKGRELQVREKSGDRWEMAFCKGDMVVIRVDEKNLPVFVINNGYRNCGFKGE